MQAKSKASKPATKRRRRIIEPDVERVSPGPGPGRPRKLQPGEKGWALSWEEVAKRARHGGSVEELSAAFEIPGDEASQSELRKIVERENARMKLTVLESAFRKGTMIGKGHSANALQNLMKLFCGLETDDRGPGDIPNLDDVKASLEAAIAKVKGGADGNDSP